MCQQSKKHANRLPSQSSCIVVAISLLIGLLCTNVQADVVTFWDYQSNGDLQTALGTDPANTENVGVDSNAHFEKSVDDWDSGVPVYWSEWIVQLPASQVLESLTATVKVRGKGRVSDLVDSGGGPYLFLQWSTDEVTWYDFTVDDSNNISEEGEMNYPSDKAWQVPSGTTLVGSVDTLPEGTTQLYVRVATDAGADIPWNIWQASGETSLIPEPGSLALLGVGGLLVLVRYRKSTFDFQD